MSPRRASSLMLLQPALLVLVALSLILTLRYSNLLTSSSAVAAPQRELSGSVSLLRIDTAAVQKDAALPNNQDHPQAAGYKTDKQLPLNPTATPQVTLDQPAMQPLLNASKAAAFPTTQASKQASSPATLLVLPSSFYFPRVELFHTNSTTHNESFIMRSPAFDHSISRDKGIIMCLYDTAFAMGITLVKELRCHGNQELIQVYHCLPDDLSMEKRQQLLDLDDRLEIIDVCSDYVNAGALTIDKAKFFKNYWVKPLAVHHSDLKELILIDADDIFLHDPAIVRDSDGYKQNGTLFFYDRVIASYTHLNQRIGKKRHPILHYVLENMNHSAFGLDGPRPSDHLLNSFAYKKKSCHEQDSSLVAIDKSRAGKAMELLWWLITQLRFKMDYSWGDKESFWLAFELAQQPYAFSPWGVSVVSSSTSKDMEKNPQTLCGSIAQYVPTVDAEPVLFYVNGRALLEPFPQGIDNQKAKPNVLHNQKPTHVSPRLVRQSRRMKVSMFSSKRANEMPLECLVGLGSTPLPSGFSSALFRRRLHYLAVISDTYDPLAVCEFQWGQH